MSGLQLIDRLYAVLNQIILLAGRDERTRAYQGVEVLRNPASATPTPAGTVQVRLEGVGQLALFFGTTPAEGDYVDVLMTETGMPIVFHNHAYGPFVPHDLLSAMHDDTVAAAVVRGDLAAGNSTPAWQRLPVGADGEVLSADSTQTLGLDWIALSTWPENLGDLYFDGDEGLVLLDFQGFEQHGAVANRANYIIGSHLERAQIGVAGDDPDDRGTVHYEPGRWPGKRGFVIEESGTNYCINPLQRDDNGDGRADNWLRTDTTAGGVTETVEDHPDKLRKGWVQRLQYTGAVGDVGTDVRHSFRTAAASFAANDDCTLSLELWGTYSGVSVIVYVRAENAANAFLGQVNTNITSDVRPNKRHFRLTYSTLPVNTDHVLVIIQISGIDNGDTFDVKTGAVNCEKTDHGTTLIHGNFGEGYAWSGAPHASTSTRNATYVTLDDYVDLITGNNTLTIRTIFRAPYDYDATWPGAGFANIMWDFRGADNNNRVMLTFEATTNDRFEVFINGAYRLNGDGFTFSEGDWIEIIVTLDFTSDEYELFINGVSYDTDTTSLTAPTITDWVVGAAYDGTTPGGYRFAEYAVLDRVLTSTEIGNLWAANRPIIDFFDNANSFTMPGTAAGVWLMLTSSLGTTLTSYTEVNVGFRTTFAGLWARAPVFFEAAINISDVAETGYAKLQYYDEATANWRDVPESELTITGTTTTNRVRTTCPLQLPLQECEYRTVQQSSVVTETAYCFRSAILVQPGGEDNL